MRWGGEENLFEGLRGVKVPRKPSSTLHPESISDEK